MPIQRNLLDIIKHNQIPPKYLVDRHVVFSLHNCDISLAIPQVVHNLAGSMVIRSAKINTCFTNNVRETSAIFWHVKTPKVPVSTWQKMALRAPRSKNGVQKPRETPPKMVG